MEIFASRSEEVLKHYHCTAGVLIRKEIKLAEGAIIPWLISKGIDRAII